MTQLVHTIEYVRYFTNAAQLELANVVNLRLIQYYNKMIYYIDNMKGFHVIPKLFINQSISFFQ